MNQRVLSGAWTLAILLLLLVIHPHVALALPVGATCQVPLPEELARSQCQAVVNYAVYVPEGLSVAELDAAASQGTGAALLGLVSAECVEETLKFVCTSAFRPCVELEAAPGVTVAVPKAVCRSTCDGFVEQCGAEVAFLAVPGSIPECDVENELLMQPEYPETGTLLAVGDAVVEVGCAAEEAQVRGGFAALPIGSCEPMQPTEFSQCSNIIDYDVFVATGSSQRETDFAVYNQSFALLWDVIEKECSAAVFRFSCTGGFLGCDAYELAPGLVLSIPRGPCPSVCEEFNFYCEEYLVTDKEDSRANCAVIPTEIVAPVSEELVFVAPCIVPPYNVTLSRKCPPLTAHDFDGECALECPNPMFSDAEWTVFFVFVTVFGWLALLSIVLVWCCFMLHPVKRWYPKSNPAWQMFYLLPTAIYAISYSLGGGLRNTACGGTHAATQFTDGFWCGYSFLFLYGGSWLSMFWYTWVGISLVLGIVGLDKLPPKIMQALFHVVPIVLVGIWFLVLALTDSIDNQGLGACGFSPRWGEWFGDLVFWIPFTLLLFVADGLLLAAFLYTTCVIGFKGVFAYWRIMAYLLVGLLATSYSSTYNWATRIEEDTIQLNLAAWVTCEAMNIFPSRCKPGRLLVFPPFLIGSIIPNLVPIIFVFILLSDPLFPEYWKYLFSRYVLRRPTPYPFTGILRAEKLSSQLESGSVIRPSPDG